MYESTNIKHSGKDIKNPCRFVYFNLFKNDIKNPDIAKSFKTKAKLEIGFLKLVLTIVTVVAIEIAVNYIF